VTTVAADNFLALDGIFSNWSRGIFVAIIATYTLKHLVSIIIIDSFK